MQATKYDQMIAQIYTAASGKSDWMPALDAVSDHLDLWGTQIIGISKKNGSLLFSLEGGIGSRKPEMVLDYLRHYHAINPRVAPSLMLDMEGWMHCHEHFDDYFVAASPFYQEFLIPHGARYMTATKLMDNNEYLVLMGALRAVGKTPLNVEQVEVLGQIKQHLIKAMEIHLHLRTTYAESGLAKYLINQLRYPVLLVDDTRGIWLRNQAANAMLQETECIIERDGLLGCIDAADDKSLMLAIRQLNLHDNTNQDTQSDKVFLRLQKRHQNSFVGAYLMAVRPQKVMGAFGATPLALVLLHDPALNSNLDPFIVAETFDLTPAEARVAVQMVNGLTADEIAQKSGVSVNTVKSQIKSLFQKTGTTRQAELVSVIHRMPELDSFTKPYQ